MKDTYTAAAEQMAATLERVADNLRSGFIANPGIKGERRRDSILAQTEQALKEFKQTAPHTAALHAMYELVSAIVEMTEGEGRITGASIVRPGITLRREARRIHALLVTRKPDK